MEEVLKQFLQAWKLGNWDKMYLLSQKTWKANHTRTEIKSLFKTKIKAFELGTNNFDDKLPCIVDISLKVKVNGKVKELTARLVKEKAKMKPSTDGDWGVNPISMLKNLYT